MACWGLPVSNGLQHQFELEHVHRVHPAVHRSGLQTVDGNSTADKKAAAVKRLVQHMQA